MDPLRLLLSITFFTILAPHMLTDTFRLLRTDPDPAGCATAGRRASSSTCWKMARRFGFWAHGRAESILLAAGITGPDGHPRSQSHQHIKLCCGGGQMTWLRGWPGLVSRHLGPLRARDIRFSPERACICIKLSSFTIPARCDSHLLPPDQGRLQISLAYWSGACRGPERAWSARHVKNHVSRGLALLLPP
jgi:hypothetical protein